MNERQSQSPKAPKVQSYYMQLIMTVIALIVVGIVVAIFVKLIVGVIIGLLAVVFGLSVQVSNQNKL